MKWLKKSFLSIILLFIVIFIFSILFTNAKPQQKDYVYYKILEEKNHASFINTKPSILVFTDLYEYEIFYKTIHIDRGPVHAPPEVDFTENMVIFLSYGEKRTSGFSIEIRKLYTRGSTIVIRAVLRSPPDGSFLAQVITHPYVLFQTANIGYKRVELIGETGEMLDYTNL